MLRYWVVFLEDGAREIRIYPYEIAMIFPLCAILYESMILSSILNLQ